MASRLNFMDLSVDLKTIIVQHVSVVSRLVARRHWGSSGSEHEAGAG
jgi:hypothetical protein